MQRSQISTQDAQALCNEELVTNAILHEFAALDPTRITHGQEPELLSRVAMLLPDICAQLLTMRALRAIADPGPVSHAEEIADARLAAGPPDFQRQFSDFKGAGAA